MERFDVIIVGAGPAGLFAGYRLSESDRSVLVIDKGQRPERRRCRESQTGVCEECAFCDRMFGIGGSGLYSDGKLNLDPRIGGNMMEFAGTEEESWEKIVTGHGVTV